MRKKSFWLCSNPRDPPPRRGKRRPPLRPCTRRPVSSEAPGLRVQRGHGARVRDRRAGHPPRRRSPSSSVSSSSSSFLPSCGFPRSFSGRFSGPGFGSRTVFSGQPSRPPFERVQVSENRVQPEVRSGAVSRADRPVPSRPSRPLRFRRVQGQFVRQVPPPSVVPVYHPVPASCSARLPFVSFMVRISVRFVFVSVRSPVLFSACLCLVLFRSFLLVSVHSSVLFVPVRLFCSFELAPLCLRPLTGDLFIYFSRILYT